MTVTAAAKTDANSKPCRWQESWGTFANWAAERLGLTLEFSGEGFCLADRPEEEQAAAPATRSGLGSALFSRRKKPQPDDEPRECYATPGELAAALLARFAQRETPPDLTPRDQPERLRDIAPCLTQAYQIDGGGLHIAGCSFTEMPFLRITTVDQVDSEPTFVHSLLDQQGNSVDATLAEQLGLANTKDLDHHPHGVFNLPEQTIEGPTSVTLSAVVWAKWVTGNVQFTLGDATLDAPFEGWASTLTAPPVTCPLTGAPTFHLTALEDGQIAAAEQATACEVSGRVMLKRDLAICSVSGKQVDPQLCDTCPVSDLPALKESFGVCGRCGERVSLAAMHGARCDACRRMRAVSTAEPAVTAILSAYPSLASLSRWRLAETNQAYLLEGGRFLRRKLLVLNRLNLSVRRVLQLGPLGRAIEMSESQCRSLLGA